MNTERDLNTRLTHEADRFFAEGGHPLEMSQVLDRAGEIKRGRRMRASMLMAACVLAIAVPTALVATRSHETPLQPAHHTKVDSAPLTLQGLERSSQPKDGYAAHGQYVFGNTAIGLGIGKNTLVSVARFAGGVIVATRDKSGDLTAHVVDEQGGTTGTSWPMEGDFAVSADGTVAAFVEPDGTPVGVIDGSSALQFMRVPRGSAFDAVAVTGTCGQAAKDLDPCAVWVQSGGKKPASWFVTSNAASTARTEYRKLADVRDNTHAAGTTVVHDDLSTCSAVEAPGLDAPGWTTCGHQMVAFSPDGKAVLAMPDGDGLGPVGLAVYDADNGDELLDLTVADQGYVRQMVWEDNSHVLATVYQHNQWGVVRIGLDGSREYAVPPVAATDDVDPPFVLPSR